MPLAKGPVPFCSGLLGIGVYFASSIALFNSVVRTT